MIWLFCTNSGYFYYQPSYPQFPSSILSAPWRGLRSSTPPSVHRGMSSHSHDYHNFRHLMRSLVLLALLVDASGWLLAPPLSSLAGSRRPANRGQLQVDCPLQHAKSALNSQSADYLSGLHLSLRQRAAPSLWLCALSGAAEPERTGVDLVVLIGFLGSTMSIMKKYSSVYEELGIETQIVIPSIPSMLLAHQGIRGGGSAAVRQLSKQLQAQGQQRRIVVHVFSNNGFIFLCSLLRTDPGLRSRLAAVILDSCPCLITPEVAATGLISAVTGRDGGAAKESRLWGAARSVLGGAVWAAAGRQEAAWDAWERRPVLAPHLFLYSRGDAVIAASEVEERMEEVRARLAGAGGGYACESRRWEEAEHCGMLRADPEGYAAALHAFLAPLARPPTPPEHSPPTPQTGRRQVE